MRRNGKKPPVLTAMIDFINKNVGKVVPSSAFTEGLETKRATLSCYLYYLCQAGYIRPANGGPICRETTEFEILKSTPSYFTVTMLRDEMTIIAGGIPVTRRRPIY